MTKRILLLPLYAIAAAVVFTAGFVQGARYELRRIRKAYRQ